MLVRQTQAQRTKPRALPRNQLEQHNVCGLESSVARMEETTTQGPLEVAPAIRHSPRSLVVNAVKAGSFGLGHVKALCGRMRALATLIANIHGRHDVNGRRKEGRHRPSNGRKAAVTAKGEGPFGGGGRWVDREGWCHKVLSQ